MRVVKVVKNFDLIWMAWFMHLGKEAMFGKVALTCWSRDEIGGFRLRADDGIIPEHCASRKISVVCSIGKQNADGVLLSTSGLDCYNNTAICMTVKLLRSLGAV